MNKFIGIGITTKDIEIEQTNSGKEYAIFQLASNSTPIFNTKKLILYLVKYETRGE